MKLQKYSILIALLICGFSIEASAQNKKSLFNGRDLNNWIEINAQETESDTAAFVVSEGIIKAYGRNKAYIKYKDSVDTYYKLSVDFRWNNDSNTIRASNKRNSGIMYNIPVQYPDEFWPKGFQFQIKDGATGDFLMMKGTSLVTLVPQSEKGGNRLAKRAIDAEKPLGEWNTAEIIFDHGHCTQRLNGTTVNEGENASELSGKIMLMYEGFPIDFKNISIETR